MSEDPVIAIASISRCAFGRRSILNMAAVLRLKLGWLIALEVEEVAVLGEMFEQEAHELCRGDPRPESQKAKLYQA